MGEEQSSLSQGMPEFMRVLDAYRTAGGESLDYRVALTTTTVDEPLADGAFRNGCGSDQRWVARTDPNAASTFACRAQVGTRGSGFEQPLKALQRALTVRVTDGTNAGFLREDALLAVVMITDEDDGSVDDIFARAHFINAS